MHVPIPGPGARLGGRYRLDDRVGGRPGWSSWKAMDETLARPVTVLACTRGFRRTADAVTAAAAASRLSDARLARVFDLGEDRDHVYVVTEWARGDSLADLLAYGPLEPCRGAEIIAECAEALACAHAAALAHLCLTPAALRWTVDTGVKIVGLGIDAALAGAAAEDPGLADARGLGMLLYAALTARWPGGDRPDGEWPRLPAAPEVGGQPCSPRQIQPGVPAGIDGVCSQVLLATGPGAQALTSPASLATALHRVIPRPAPAALAQVPPPAPPVRPPPGSRATATRMMACIAALLVAAATGTGAWTLGHRGAWPRPAGSAGYRPAPVAAVTVLAPVAAHGFDPLSSAAEDPGNENTGQARFAIDGRPGTAWHTQYYLGNPRFGGLKAGSGLILDMGRPVTVSSVTVSLGPARGANVRVEVGNAASRTAGTLRAFTTIARERRAGGTVVFTARAAVTGRFVLIWFTRLPPQAPGSRGVFQAEIANLTIRGTR